MRSAASEPILGSTFSTKVLSADLKVLRQQGFPLGVAKELVVAKMTFPIRFWVVDKSCSMETSDGIAFLDTASKDDIQVVSCTRWKDFLQGAVTYHTQLAGLLQATTVFRVS
jgi:hypothetical protein